MNVCISLVRGSRWLLCALLLLTVVAMAAAQTAKPFLHPLFADNMVLQRGIADPVWGWTTPGAKVTVQMDGKSATATADAGGKWLAKIGPFTSGGPYTMTVTGPQTVTLQNVLVGDVWICSGQSNMQMGLNDVTNGPQEVAQADHPNLRLLVVRQPIRFAPESTVEVQSWQPCTPTSARAMGWGGFSAAAYFFGRALQSELNIPIGLIETCYSGTVAQAWTSKEALQKMGGFEKELQLVETIGADQQGYIARIEQGIADWWKSDRGTVENWGAKTDLDTAAWNTVTLPAPLETFVSPTYDGVVWFSRTIDLPAEWAGKNAVIHLGRIDNRDVTYVNGEKVGGHDWDGPQRIFRIPGKLMKAGRNIITVRTLDFGGVGGFTGKPEDMFLEVQNMPTITPVSLAGAWKYQATFDIAGHPYPPERQDGNPNGLPSSLYNGMIHPLIPFAITGAIWYQGESNASGAKQYRTLLPTMITDWRSRWGVGNFPFYIVGLANHGAVKPMPSESSFANLREAQYLTTLAVPNCGLATAIDIGDATNIHPKNKQDVGKRLALNALALTYGKKIEYSGPVYKAMRVEGNKIRLTFDHLGGGLVAKADDGKLTGFAICGADKRFVWADAVIDGDTILVSAPTVTTPVAVRYAWADTPICNLYNKANLPAVPFRTDRE